MIELLLILALMFLILESGYEMFERADKINTRLLKALYNRLLKKYTVTYTKTLQTDTDERQTYLYAISIDHAFYVFRKRYGFKYKIHNITKNKKYRRSLKWKCRRLLHKMLHLKDARKM